MRYLQVRVHFLSMLATVLAAAPAALAQFNVENLVILRAGNGTTALTANGSPLFLEQWTTGGSAVNTLTIPTSSSTPGGTATSLVLNGTATSEGFMHASTNGLGLSLAGYAASHTSSVSTATAATVNRRILDVNIAGTLNAAVTSTTMFSGQNIRSTIKDGANYWASGSGTGTIYANTPATISTSTTNQRALDINTGRLFYSTGSGTAGIHVVANGLPTSGSNAGTSVIATGAGASPYGFSFSTSLDTCYIADDRASAAGGIQKWTYNGTVWSLAYTLGTGVANVGARGLHVDWSNPGTAVIYATTGETTGNRMIKIVDTGAGSVASTLATATGNSAYRGVQMIGEAAVWTNASAGTQTWSAGTTTNSLGSSQLTMWSGWSKSVVDGIRVSFQNVNSTGGALAINPDLDVPAITTVSEIRFTSGGYGTNPVGTTYTLQSSANFGLTLGTAGTFSYVGGITNDSTNTQTINLNLTLGGSQSFTANNGNLTIGGTVALGSGANNYTLTVAGNKNTLLGNSVTDGGSSSSSIAKTGTGTLILTSANTYSGGTTINGGKVTAANATGSATGSGNVIVNAGGTLGGGNAAGTIGFISGSVSVNGTGLNQGTIAPGNSTGILTVGATSINSGGAYAWEVSSTTNNAVTAGYFDGGSGSAGVDHDKLVVNGNLDFNAGSTFSISSIDNSTSSGASLIGFTNTGVYSWLVATATGAINGIANVFIDDSLFVAQNGSLGSGQFYLTAVGSNLILTFSPVPEPTLVLGMGISLAAAGMLIRRRLHRINPVTT